MRRMLHCSTRWMAKISNFTVQVNKYFKFEVKFARKTVIKTSNSRICLNFLFSSTSNFALPSNTKWDEHQSVELSESAQHECVSNKLVSLAKISISMFIHHRRTEFNFYNNKHRSVRTICFKSRILLIRLFRLSSSKCLRSHRSVMSRRRQTVEWTLDSCKIFHFYLPLNHLIHYVFNKAALLLLRPCQRMILESCCRMRQTHGCNFKLLPWKDWQLHRRFALNTRVVLTSKRLMSFAID